jgi:diadenosine tetraphosphatase ApaH/serine/threonine PP2A family protein phosphatase
VSERCSLCLVGNHDLAVLGELDISSFSPAAAEAVRWTREIAKPETLEFLKRLEPADTSHEVALYHASPRDPVWEYVLWPDQAAECIRAQDARVSLVGHSHVALFFALAEDGAAASGVDARGAQAGAGTRLELERGRWLINPGSVGQPRDGDPRAAWLELDTEAWSATYHRVSYEIDRAAEAIAATELPEHLARRLYVGQ